MNGVGSKGILRRGSDCLGLKNWPLVALMLLVALMHFGCVGSPNGEAAWQESKMYFGLSTPTGEVTAAQFAAFVDRVVTPAFPDGLTVQAGSGQWQSGDGSVVRENSRILIILHPASVAADQSLLTIGRAYAEEFHQDAVLLTQTPVARVEFVGGTETVQLCMQPPPLTHAAPRTSGRIPVLGDRME